MIGQLLNGLAWQLHAAGLGTYNPTGVYSNDQTGITIRAVPSAPDRLIVLTPYGARDQPDNDSTTGVQVRFRVAKDPRPLQDLSDGVFELWHNLAGVQIGGVPVVLISRTSVVPIGQDTAGRFEQSDNYDVQFSWPTPNRTD